GYGLGEAGEGRNSIHNTKTFKERKKALVGFRERFDLNVSDEVLETVTFVQPPADSPEIRYMHERRQALGGYLPQRRVKYEPLTPPGPSFIDLYRKGSVRSKDPSTTMVFVDQLKMLLKDKGRLGKYLVPIIPDEARTFGMESYFADFKIYASQGQKYVPVDDDTLAAYREAKDGQVLEEGINEAGAISSFIAAGTSYATHGVPMCPFYIYYSMFGFQRIGDLIWAAADLRCRGFLLGATAGRTTLNGEGLQHEDGHSHVLASTVPNVMAYDPAFAYELAVILRDGIRRMYGPEPEDILYYVTLYNDNYEMPAMPEGCEEGILKGMYKMRPSSLDAKGAPKAHLFGSGPILPHVLRAQTILAEKFGVAADVWSVTSYKQLRADGLACDRWNLLHPDQTPRTCYVEQVLSKEGKNDVYVAASDYMRCVQEMINRWVPGGLYALGTDGFGRSETRQALRRHFEVDAESVALATLYQMSRKGLIPTAKVAEAIKVLGIDPEKINPLTA
ncbi:MAG: pyruvate dehydrogenase (acetyl-transferring), homodimeric type, partial [Planctomycetia bacterium]|nr:pyruvate dehydrogenase (acetyl-transferring), homodimeric type [Planctomycetia bacterium]